MENIDLIFKKSFCSVKVHKAKKNYIHWQWLLTWAKQYDDRSIVSKYAMTIETTSLVFRLSII